MHITITLDEDLVRKAQELSGITDLSALLHEGLKALIDREAAPPHRTGKSKASPESN
jgi:post-segregation antitoxin (ccd killing protein)